jgi:hypothetical protein
MRVALKSVEVVEGQGIGAGNFELNLPRADGEGLRCERGSEATTKVVSPPPDPA